MATSKLKSFQTEPVTYTESQSIKDGVVCDVYLFVENQSKDLSIVTVSKCCCTPKQKVLKGEKTLEIYLNGSGKLFVTSTLGIEKEHYFPNNENIQQIEVVIGETMRWHADTDSDLQFAEICWPPFAPDRFEEII